MPCSRRKGGGQPKTTVYKDYNTPVGQLQSYLLNTRENHPAGIFDVCAERVRDPLFVVAGDMVCPPVMRCRRLIVVLFFG